MKVLHISYSDSLGGAAIAAYRHHEAMLQTGIDSKMLVLHKISHDASVHELPHKKTVLIGKLFNTALLTYYNFYAGWTSALFGYDLRSNRLVRDADVIYLHWINRMVSIKGIENVLKLGKPVYWYMHDMWPLTGGCNYSLTCNMYRSECARCPMAFNGKGSSKSSDLSNIQFKEKINRLSPYENLRFITPSSWLAGRVSESSLFKTHMLSVIRNPINTDIFTTKNKTEARKSLGLPLNRKLILFGADNINNPYKGWNLLKGALQDTIPGADCVIYGSDNVDVQSALGLKLHSLGKISDSNVLIDLYNACDIYVTPTVADNYPNVIIEAKACGLPIVGSAIGGVPEMIEDFKTGRMVHELNPEGFRNAIIHTLDNLSDYDSNLIRHSVLTENSYSVIARKHMELLQ